MRTCVVNHFRSLAEQLVDGVGVDEVECVNYFDVRIGGLVSGIKPPAPGSYQQEYYCCRHGQQGYKVWPATMLLGESCLDFGYILEPFSRILPQASADDPLLIWKQQRDHLSKRPDVRPVVDDASGKELWSSETGGSGRTFENRPGTCVREAEVDEFEIVPVVGYEYVRGLEIPVDDLFGMEIAQSVTELESDLFGRGPSWPSTGKKFCQSHSIYPFHLDTVAESGNIPEIIYFPDGGVGETVADLVFFPEEGFVSSLSSEGRLQGFEGSEPSVFVYEPDFAPTCLGGVNQILRFVLRQAQDVAQIDILGCLVVCGGEKCGIVWHDAKGNKK